VKHKDKRAILICCWIVAAYALYTAIKTKLHWYVMPIYPALAFSSAIFMERFLKNRAFKFSVAAILIIMLLQVPISWAFKLDFNPEVKKVSAYAREFYKRGNDIYIIGGSSSEMFYCDFAREFNKNLYDSLIAGGADEIYCIILPEELNQTAIKYNFEYDPIYESKRLSFYKIRFK